MNMCFNVKSKSIRRPSIVSAVLWMGYASIETRIAVQRKSFVLGRTLTLHFASLRIFDSVELVERQVDFFEYCPVLRRGGRGYAGKAHGAIACIGVAALVATRVAVGRAERCSWCWLLQAFVFVHVLDEVLPTKYNEVGERERCESEDLPMTALPEISTGETRIGCSRFMALDVTRRRGADADAAECFRSGCILS